MQSLKVLYSTKTERLAERFAAAMCYRKDPLRPIITIVQTEGMNKWLQLEVARQNKISANVSYLSPREFINYTGKELFGMAQSSNPYSPSTLRWAIFKTLISNIEVDADLIKYTSNKMHKTWSLSCKIADIFDQYFMYRPQLIRDWNNNIAKFNGTEYEKHETWQKKLWGQIKQKYPEHKDPVEEYSELFNKIASADPKYIQNKLGEVSIFGVTTLAPQHLRFFELLAQKTRTTLYLLTPSNQYWEHLISEKKKAKLALKEMSDDALLLLDTGNELLASMGEVGKNFLRALMECDADITNIDPDVSTADTNKKSALQVIQSDIENLEQQLTALDNKKIKDSLEIVSCYSEMREVEVLYDKLLEAFDQDPTLQTSEVVVMTPDIDKYAPIIDAVFGNSKIPYSITDRSLIKEIQETELFIDLLKIAMSRFELSKILEILNNTPIRIKFEMEDEVFEIISYWLSNSGYRWGVDEKFRRNFLDFDLKENTWVELKRRLLMGYAMELEQFRDYKGIFPDPNVGQTEAQAALAPLINFMDSLAELTKLKDQKKTIPQWVEILTKVITDFFPDNNADVDTSGLRAKIGALYLESRIAGVEDALDFQTILLYLEEAFSIEKSSRVFLDGKVLFCSMIPMRSIPSKVIALIGLNDGDFPRKVNTIQFDLLKADKQFLDRSVRDNDLYLFLESLLSARKKLYVSYIGKNINDAKPQEPSLLIHELADYTSKRFNLDKKELITEYPLHSFSNKYIKEGSTLVTYSTDPLVHAITNEQEVKVADFSTSKEEINKKIVLTPQQFASFFKDPIKNFLLKVAKIRLYESTDAVKDAEPLHSSDVDDLSNYLIIARLLEQGVNLDGLEKYLKSAGCIPLEHRGKEHMVNMYSTVSNMLSVTNALTKGKNKQQTEIDLTFNLSEGFILNIKGSLDNVYDDILINYKPGSIKNKDIVYSWVLHLLHNKRTFLIGKKSFITDTDEMEQVWEYTPVETPEVELKKLAAYYVQGLYKPLLFVPEPMSSFTPYARFLESKYLFSEEGSPYYSETVELQEKIEAPIQEYSFVSKKKKKKTK